MDLLWLLIYSLPLSGLPVKGVSRIHFQADCGPGMGSCQNRNVFDARIAWMQISHWLSDPQNLKSMRAASAPSARAAS